jgi:predicted flap endonuclease-1-like 5' DNA nuclease
VKRLTRIGGIVVGLGTGAVAALWLLKDKITGPPPAPVFPENAPAFRVAPPSIGGDDGDLIRIKGIGPVFAGRLSEAGIDGIAALAAADPAAIADRIGVPAARVEEWIAAARVLTDG